MTHKRSTLATIGCDLAVVLILIVCVQIGTGWLTARTVLSAIPQLLYRDSAATIANFVESELAKGRGPEEALRIVERDVASILPGSALLITDRSGQVRAVAGECHPNGLSASPELFAAFQGPFIPNYPLPHRELCLERETLLSGALIHLQEGMSSLMLTSARPTLAQTLSWPPFTHDDEAWRFARWMAAPLTFLFVWSLGSYWIFRRQLFAHARALNERADRFVSGDLSVRFEPDPFPEYEELAEAFNALATEVSAQLGSLSRDEAERREVVGGLAHDLRTPMTAIHGCMALLDSGDRSASRRRTDLDVIRSCAVAQEELTDQLEVLARLEYRVPVEDFVSIDPGALMQEVIAALRPIAEHKGVAILTDIDESVPPLLGSPGLLKRALLNLGLNGLQHTPGGKAVRFAVKRTNDQTTAFDVSDEGPGIVREGMTDGTRTDPRANNGFIRRGLGLTIVNRIAEMHRGNLEIVDASSAGTQMRVSLPSCTASASLMADPPPIHEPVLTPVSRNRLSVFAHLIFFASTLIASVTELVYAPTIFHRCLALLIVSSILLPRILGSRRQTAAVTAVSVALILALALTETAASRLFLLGVASATGGLSMACGRRGKSSLFSVILIAVPIVVPYLCLAVPWFFLLGSFCGLWSVGIVWYIEVIPRGRRAGVWLSGLLFFGAGIAASLQGAAIYGFVMRTARQFAIGLGPEILDGTLDRMRQADGDEELRVETFIRSYLINPLADYELVDDAGAIAMSAGLTRDDTEALQKMASMPGGLAGYSRRVVPRTFRRVFLGAPLCTSGRCDFLNLALPSDVTSDLIHRDLAALMTMAITFNFFVAGVLLTILGSRWSRHIRARFERVRHGLQGFRQGNFVVSAPTSHTDDLGVLTRTLDGLAERIAELRHEIEVRRERQSQFLHAAARLLRDATGQVIELVGRESPAAATTSRALQVATRFLGTTIESIFELTYLERGELKLLQEEFSLAEFVYEEGEEYRTAQNCAIDIDVDEVLGPCLVYSAPHPLGEILRLFLDAALERNIGSKPVSLRLTPSDAGYEITVQDFGPTIPDERLRRIFEPLEWIPTDRSDDAMPAAFRGFSLSLIVRKLALCGVTVDIRSEVPRGLHYRVFIPIRDFPRNVGTV